jgi:hypothetical protein
MFVIFLDILRWDTVSYLMQLFRAGILDVRAVPMVGVMEQDFIQASPIKDFPTLRAPREMLFFFRRKLFVFVSCHRRTFAHSLRLASSNAITRSTLPIRLRSRVHAHARGGQFSQPSLTRAEIRGFVLTFVLTLPFFEAVKRCATPRKSVPGGNRTHI